MYQAWARCTLRLCVFVPSYNHGFKGDKFLELILFAFCGRICPGPQTFCCRTGCNAIGILHYFTVERNCGLYQPTDSQLTKDRLDQNNWRHRNKLFFNLKRKTTDTASKILRQRRVNKGNFLTRNEQIIQNEMKYG